jgi:galactokinase
MPGVYPHWTTYVAGVVSLLQRRGAHVPGCDLVIASDVPVGGGLSSSAALEVACALALARLANVSLEGRELADLCRAAEHEFAGVPCGIMDQYASVLAQPGCALWLDCRARTWEYVPLPLGEHVVLIVNSGVHHELATSAYARRQAECRAAVERLHTHDPAVESLRDVTPMLLADAAATLPETLLRRARHVVTENARTCAAVAALRGGDLPAFGRRLDESHVSLRDDYAVSCRELDLLVEIVRAVPGALGARLTGGGFGGCIVAIAERASIATIEARLRSAYDATGRGPATLLLSRPGSCAGIDR